ncbi:hypothetical protein MNEG_16387, partial [Monoraphidium neglectum]
AAAPSATSASAPASLAASHSCTTRATSSHSPPQKWSAPETSFTSRGPAPGVASWRATASRSCPA